MAKQKKSKRTAVQSGKRKHRTVREPSHYQVLRQPDITALAAVRFAGKVFVQLCHQDYTRADVTKLLRDGQIELDPIAPGQVGALVLNGVPYTVVGYYTFAAQEAEYERGPEAWS
jgi:hypothetical protein